MDGPFYRDARMHLKTVSPTEVLVAFVIALHLALALLLAIAIAVMIRSS